MYISCTITIYFLLLFSSATDDITSTSTTSSEGVNESSKNDVSSSSSSQTESFTTLFSSDTVSQETTNSTGNSSNATSSLTAAVSSTTTTSDMLWKCLTGQTNCTNGTTNLALPTQSSNAAMDNTLTAVPRIKSPATINENQWPILFYSKSFLPLLKPTNKTSVAVPVSIIVKSIFDNNTVGDMGIVVIETGDSSLGEWQVNTTASGTQFTSISRLLDSEQMTTLMGTQFTNLFAVFHLPITQYDKRIRTILLLSPYIRIRFQSSVTDQTVWDNLSCTSSSLIFLAVNWAAISQSFRSLSSTTVLQTANCTDCGTWPISQEIIRICPERRSTLTSATTTTTKLPTVKSTTTTTTTSSATTTTTATTISTTTTAEKATTSTSLPESTTTTTGAVSTQTQKTATVTTTELPTTTTTPFEHNSSSSSTTAEQTTTEQPTSTTTTVGNQEGTTSAHVESTMGTSTKTDPQQQTTTSGERITVTSVPSFAPDTTVHTASVTSNSPLTTFSSTMPTTSSTSLHDSSTRVTSLAPTKSSLSGTTATIFTSSSAFTSYFPSTSKSMKTTERQLSSTSMHPPTTTTMHFTSTITDMRTTPVTTTVAPTTSTFTTSTTSSPKTSTVYSTTSSHTTKFVPPSFTSSPLKTTVLLSSSTRSPLKTSTVSPSTSTSTTPTFSTKTSRLSSLTTSSVPLKTTTVSSSSSTSPPTKKTAVSSTFTTTFPSKTTVVYSPSTSSSLRTTIVPTFMTTLITPTTSLSKTTVVASSLTSTFTSTTALPFKTTVVSSSLSARTSPTRSSSLNTTPKLSSAASTFTSTTTFPLKTTVKAPSSSTVMSPTTYSISNTTPKLSSAASTLTSTVKSPFKTTVVSSSSSTVTLLATSSFSNASPMSSSSPTLTSSATSGSLTTTASPSSTVTSTASFLPKTTIVASSTFLTTTTTSPLKTPTVSFPSSSTKTNFPPSSSLLMTTSPFKATTVPFPTTAPSTSRSQATFLTSNPTLSVYSSTSITSPSTHSLTATTSIEEQTDLLTSTNTMVTLKEVSSTSSSTAVITSGAVTTKETSATTSASTQKSSTTEESIESSSTDSSVHTETSASTNSSATSASITSPATTTTTAGSTSPSTSSSSTSSPNADSTSSTTTANQTILSSPATSTANGPSSSAAAQTSSTKTTTVTTKTPGPDCAGVQRGTASVNSCGFCVNGTTGRNSTYGFDQCGVCNGTDACVGCDGAAWSGRQYDQCRRCLLQSDANFGIPCNTVALNGIYPMLLDSQQSKHTLTLSIADTSEGSEFTVQNCWLQDALLATYNGTAVKENKTTVALSVDRMLLSGMVLSVHCMINNKAYNFSDSVLVTNFQLAVNQSGASPTRIILGYDASILVSFDQAIESQYFIDAPSCLLSNGTVLPALRSGDNSSFVICDLSSITTNGTIELRAVRGGEMRNATITFQVPIAITFQDKKPSLTTVQFSDDLTSLLINFDENIQPIGGQCMRLFSMETRIMFGAGSSCSIRAATIVVTFGHNATLLPSNLIMLELALVERFTHSIPASPSPHTMTTETQIPENSPTSFMTGYSIPSTASPNYIAASINMPSTPMTPDLSVYATHTLILCEHHVNVVVRRVFGDGGRPLMYTWTISSPNYVSPAVSELVASMHNRTLMIPRSMLENLTEYDLTVQACNFAAQCSNPMSLPVSVSVDTTSFDVKIRGLSSPILSSRRLNIAADPTFQKCGETHSLPPSDVKYSWLINNVRVDNGSTLRIAAFQFVVGQSVVVSLEAEFTDPDTNMTYTDLAESQFVISSEPLIVVVDGTTRSINDAHNLVIDCSLSSDPNVPPNASLQHSWSCLTSTNTACAIPQTVDMMAAVLTVPAGTLQADQMYTFVDTIKSSGLEASATVNVTVVSANIPTVQLLALSVERPNVDDYIRFQARVSSSAGVLSTAWSFVETPGCAYFDLTAYFPTAERNFSAQDIASGQSVLLSFTLPPAGEQMYPDWPGLAISAEYVMRIEATNEAGTAYSDFHFITNAPPTIGQFNVNPASSIVSLETSVELSVGDGWYDLPQDQPFTYRFGLRTLLVGNQLEDDWFYESSQDQINLFLAAAWPAPHAVCNQRTGYHGLVMVCDRLGACSQTISRLFVVNHPTNLSVAVTALTYSLNSDLASGNTFDASQKMQAIRKEQCLDSLDQQLSAKIAMNVLGDLSRESDLDEFVDGVDQTLRLLPTDASMQSNDTLMELARVASSLRKMLGLSTSDGSTSRKKRSTSMVSPISIDVAATLLKSYDELLSLGQDVVTVYLKNILDILAGFCVQLDRNRGPLAANGLEPTPLTYTQAQVVDASNVNLPNMYFSAAASNGSNTLSVNAGFRDQFASWQCGSPPSSCIEVCIATASIDDSALDLSPYLRDYFFLESSTMAAAQADIANALKYVNRSRLQSDMHHISLVDQQQGDFVNLGSQSTISIRIPIDDFIPAQYYACFLFMSGLWDSSQCMSVTISQPGSTYMDCTCKSTGFIGIFTVAPPIPVPYPPQMEISIAIGLDTVGTFTAGQVHTMLAILANTTGIVLQRFVLFNVTTNSKGQPILKGVLRPPFRPYHLSNSYSVQALNRTLNTAGAAGLLLYSASGIAVRAKPYTLVAQPIPRALVNDGNARKVTIRIDCDYDTVETDATIIGASWMTSIASTLGLENYRIKSASLAAGSVLMSMTVTKPATTENASTAVSAEEVAAMIAEQAIFGELLITDEDNNPLNVYPNDTQVVTLIDEPVSAQSQLLVIILGVGLGGFFVIVIVMVLIMVILKTRAEQHRRELMWSADNALLESIQTRKSKPEVVDVEQSSSSSGRSSTVRFADSAESRTKKKKKRKSASRH